MGAQSTLAGNRALARSNANNMDGVGGQQILKAPCGDDSYHLLILLKLISTTTVSLEALSTQAGNRALAKARANGIIGMNFYTSTT